MTREEAIMVLKMVEAHGLADEAKRMAIEALKGGDADIPKNQSIMQQSRHDDGRVTTVTLNSPISIQAEMVAVVRCKDCRHRYISGNGTTNYYVCDFMDAQYTDNGYCHHGERREP